MKIKVTVKYKKILVIKLMVCFISLNISLTACTTVEPKPYIYIALGDSVASGYGLVSPTDRYTYIFYEMLRKEGYMFIEEKINKATAGYTTTDLLELLNSMTNEQLKLFKNARIITLNIGGNNILVPFSKYLDNNQNVIIEEDEIEEKNDDEESENKELKEKAIAAWNAITDTITSTIDKGRVVLGYFPDELKDTLNNGVQTFTEEFKEIIKWIENHAPRATLIVSTIYNPIPDKVWIIPVELSNKADEHIRTMNDIIIEKSDISGYFVADVYSNFATDDVNVMNVTQFNLNPFGGFMSIDIIHPNRAGHTIIAELIYEQYQIARELKK